MKLNILKTIIIPVALAGALVSCNKDKKNEVLPSLDGTITYYAPEFIQTKGTLTMTPTGAKHPEDKGIGYYWKISSLITKGDTTRFENGLDKNGKKSDGTLKYTFPDTLGTFTINCYAFASGYTGKTTRKVLTTVDTKLEGSLKGRGIKAEDKHITTADGQTYYYTTINGKDWFRNNLNADGGIPYRKSLLMSNIFGKYYTYEEAVNACPEGWRLPTEEDWLSLAKAYGAADKQEKYSNIPAIAKKLMANAQFNDVTMWDYWREVGDITNESAMAMIPAGYVLMGEKDTKAKKDEWLDLSYPDAEFKGIYDYAAFWTADTNGENAFYRYLYVKSPEFKIGQADKKSFGASVRCVRDSK